MTSIWLKLIDLTLSGGKHPVSFTTDRNLLYVLNDGTLMISGLRVSPPPS